MSVCWRSPVSSSSRSSSSSLRSRASSSRRSSMSAGSSIEKTRKSPCVVHLDGRVPRGTRRLLVGGEQGVLERGDERALFDALVALDLANRLDDLLAHSAPTPLRRSGSPARSASYGISMSALVDAGGVSESSSAATSSPRRRRSAVFASHLTRRPTKRAKCARRAQRPLDPRRRDVDRVLAQVVAEQVGDAAAERVVDARRDGRRRRRKRPGRCSSTREHVDARQVVLDPLRDLSAPASLSLS